MKFLVAVFALVRTAALARAARFGDDAYDIEHDVLTRAECGALVAAAERAGFANRIADSIDGGASQDLSVYDRGVVQARASCTHPPSRLCPVGGGPLVYYGGRPS